MEKLYFNSSGEFIESSLEATTYTANRSKIQTSPNIYRDTAFCEMATGAPLNINGWTIKEMIQSDGSGYVNVGMSIIDPHGQEQWIGYVSGESYPELADFIAVATLCSCRDDVNPIIELKRFWAKHTDAEEVIDGALLTFTSRLMQWMQERELNDDQKALIMSLLIKLYGEHNDALEYYLSKAIGTKISTDGWPHNMEFIVAHRWKVPEKLALQDKISLYNRIYPLLNKESRKRIDMLFMPLILK